MSIADENAGIAYGIVYIFMVLIMVGGVWISFGVTVDEFDSISNDLSSNDIWGAKVGDKVDDLCDIWGLIPWLTVGCSFIYALITAIRKERGGIMND